MSFIIRNFACQDQGEVAAIIAGVLAEYNLSVDLEHIVKDISTAEERYAGDRGLFLVAEIDKRIVGSIAIRPMHGKVAELKRFYVQRGFRHRGIGRALFAKAEEFCAQAGYEKIWLESSRRFTEAQQFYQVHGFVVVDAIDNEWEDNIYEKQLRQALREPKRQADIDIGRLQLVQCDAAGYLVAANDIFQPYGFTPERVARFLGKALQAGEEIISCELGDRLVGVLWIQPRVAFGSSGYIKLVAVAPEAQGHGVGRAMIEEAERVLLTHDPNVFLMVTATNTNAQAFYQRMGYRAIGVLKDYVLSGVDEVLMRKSWGPIRSS